MDHFSVVQSLCRIGLESSDARFRSQVVRLRDRLHKSGAHKEAGTLDRLLREVDVGAVLAPSVVEVSRGLLQGEQLSSNVHPPVDRETSVPLAEIILEPTRDRPAPIYNDTLQLALDALVAEWAQEELLRKFGVEPSRSCLIYGPPGTGKTLTAFTLAGRLGLPVINARIDGLVSSFLGTTARNIANLFDFANRYRCVLVLDEFDALAKMRDDPHELGEIKRVVNTLLQNLDARSGIGLTMAITNHDGLLDPAVWRRFENHIRLDEPDLQTRVLMLEVFLEPIKADSDLIRTLALVLGRCSGSDLKTFADALKRSVALSGEQPTSDRLIATARSLLPRFEFKTSANELAQYFLNDEARFVGAVLDSGLGIRQESLAHMLQTSQSTISRLAKDWRAKDLPNTER